MASQQPCPLCNSLRFHLDAGRTFCANGHEQALGLLVENEDDADFMRRRGGKLHRDPKAGKGAAGKGDGRLLRGKAAWELWAKAWGGVLWRVCWTLGRLLDGEDGDDGQIGTQNAGKEKMKEEMWHVVRALWALRLQELVAKWEMMGDDELVDMKSEAGSESEDFRTTDEDEEGMRTSDSEGAKKPKKHKLSDEGMPKLIDTIALNYLGLLLMRYPLSLHTLYTWLQAEAIPYTRAIRHVPKEIRDRLPPEYHRSLDTLSILQPEELQLAIYRNAKFYQTQFNTVLPPLNWRPLLLSWIETLALPLQTYAMVKQLNTICEFDFAYPDTSESTPRRNALTYPELQLMALLVISVKLLFPFNAATVKRYPSSSSGAGVIRIDWDVWIQAKQAFEASVLTNADEPLQAGTQMQLTDRDVLNMSDADMDGYMDWYQDMWMSSRAEGEGVQKEIFGLFPTRQLPEQDNVGTAKRRGERVQELRQERLQKVLGGLKARNVITEEKLAELELEKEGISEGLLRPGMRFEVFRRKEDLQGAAKEFHEEGAKVACVDVGGLLRAITRTEGIIERWRVERKRQGAFVGEKEEDVIVGDGAEEEVLVVVGSAALSEVED